MNRSMKKAILFGIMFVASPVVLAKGGGGGGHGGGGHSSGGHSSAHVSSHATAGHVAPAKSSGSSSGSLFGGWNLFGGSRPAPIVSGRSTSSCKDQQGNPCK